MTNHVSAHAARLSKLRGMFVAQVPSKLTEARDLLAVVKKGDDSNELTSQLKRVFHNLKGTSASFGLKELSGEAEAAEMLIDHLMRQPGLYTIDFINEVLQHIAKIDHLAAQSARDMAPSVLPSIDKVFTPTAHNQQKDINSRRTIYVCDDDDVQIRQINSQLTCFGYDVHCFLTIDSLRQAVRKQKPDAVVMDVVFPEGEDAGLKVVAEFREMTGEVIPTIFISGRSDFQARLQAVKVGGKAFLNKTMHGLDIVEHLDALTTTVKPEPYSVLVIDDEPLVAAYHASILEEAGIIVHVTHNPSAALVMLRELRPELVLMDVHMPDCEGYELAQVIRQMPEYVSIPIIYLSSETDAAIQRSALAVGADGFLIKSITPEELISAVVVRAERMRTLRSLMVRDSLTGLYNHTAIMQFLEGEVAGSRRRKGRLCFAMIDVDHFKKVNDTYGHPVGDQVLISLARILKQQLRQNDLVGRYGGEEFAVVLLDATIEKACELLNALREDFGGVKFWANDQEFSVTISIGVAQYPGCEGVGALCELADNALYAAKRGGRNRVMIAGPGGTFL